MPGKKKKRVAILTNRLLDWTTREPAFGGAERYCITLGGLLKREGFDVSLFQAGHSEFEGQYYGFPVRALPIGGFFSEFHYGICNRFTEETRDFDHVIINAPSYGSGNVREDAITICHGIWFDHDSWGPPIQFRTPEWYAHLYKVFSQPARVISVDTNVINVIRSLWPDLTGRMRYVPNAVDTKVFHPRPRTSERLTVLIPRRADVTRGTRLMEPLLAAVPHDVRFLWVGDGDPEELERLRAIARHDKRLELQSAAFDDMPAIYAAADITLIPTVGAEGTSLACLEALASGCAVVSTNVGGLPDLVHDRVNGLLVDPNAASIAAAINEVVTNAALRAELQRSAAESASHFNIEGWESRWRALLAELGWTGKAKRATARTSRAADIPQGVRLATASGGSESATRIAYLEGQLSEWNRIFDGQHASLSFLQNEVVARDKQIEFLSGEVSALRTEAQGKSESLEFLRGEVASRDRVVESQKQELLDHQRAVEAHRQTIEFLKRELDGVGAEAAKREAEASKRESEAAKRESEAAVALRAARRVAEAMKSELEIREAQVKKLEVHTAQQADGIEWLRDEMALREEKLQSIYRSKLWRSASVYWRGRHFAKRLASGPKALALKVGRRVLPRSVKTYIKRLRASKEIAAATATQPQPMLAVVPGARSQTPAPSKFDVICFSIIDWSFRWQRPQQVMARLAKEGHRVFFLSTTEFLPANGERYRVTPLRENVWELKISTPFALDVYGGEMSPEFAQHIAADFDQLRRDFNITCAVSFVQVPTWSAAAYAARQRFGWRVVYDCMDEWNTFPGMKKPLLEAEKELVRKADVVAVTAQRLVEKWKGDHPGLLLARNAADFDHYSNVQPNDLLANLPHPVVGYFGAIADWFDLKLMVRLAKERPQYSFVLIGGIFNVPMKELEKLPNVTILGQKPYELMPLYLWHFDVCIIPFVVNAVTEATDPVKFYEYISMGKPVVAPRMPELYGYRDYLYIADDHDDFLKKVDAAVAERDPAMVEKRIALARRNTWAARVADIRNGIRDAHEKVSIVVITYHNLDYSKLCINSVFRNTVHPNFELIVVDNASNDGTPDYLKQLAAEHDNVRIILNDHNLGFARANNQGVEISSGDHVVLLNNDTVVPNGWLPKLLRHLEKPELGLIVTVTNFSGNESRIAVPYKDDMTEMEEFAARYTTEHEGEMFDIRVAAMYCVAMRRDVYDKVGPLDEQFSIGMFEDDDYSERVRRAGYRVVCVEDVFVHHFGQASFRKLKQSEYQALWERNQRLYEKKWGVQWKPHTLRAGMR